MQHTSRKLQVLEMKINTFDLDSVSCAINKLKMYRESIDIGLKTSISELTKKGYEYMMSHVPEDTGTLKNSIIWEFDKLTQKGTIKIGADYVLFVEYGTGIVGKKFPHPDPKSWKYDVNNHGVKGWWYFDDSQNKIRWTRGRSASAFVYKTMKFLEKEGGKGIVVKMNG